MVEWAPGGRADVALGRDRGFATDPPPMLPSTSLPAMSRPPFAFLACVVALAWAASGNTLRAQAFNDFQIPPHDYNSIQGRDAMSRLLGRAAAGDFEFGEETGRPLLRRLLAELGIPESSQVLLFSKTSLQREHISPENPRAIFFNENGYVSWMPDGLIEVLMFDPDAGGLFFIEELPEERSDPRIAFAKGRGCTGCHSGSATNFLPGPMARSSYVDVEGRRIGSVSGHIRMNHAMPPQNRWGGFYVTGAPASLGHLGNAFARKEGKATVLDRPEPSPRSDLSGFFDAARYPRPDANVFPLLLFDHQIEAHNLLMEVRYRWRLFEYERAKFGGKASSLASEGLERGMRRLVRYLLFADEAPLDGSGLVVSEQFRRDFAGRRRADPEGRSLRDPDLRTRLFSHRLSYMIYSQAFEDAPLEMRETVYARLHEILLVAEAPEGFGYFDPGEREAIVAILRATKDDLPPAWRAGAAEVVASSSVRRSDRSDP